MLRPVRPGPRARLFPREGLRRLLVPHPPPPFSGARRTQPMGAAPRVVAASGGCSLVPPRDRIPSPPPTATICGTASAATTYLPRRRLSPSSTADLASERRHRGQRLRRWWCSLTPSDDPLIPSLRIQDAAHLEILWWPRTLPAALSWHMCSSLLLCVQCKKFG